MMRRVRIRKGLANTRKRKNRRFNRHRIIQRRPWHKRYRRHLRHREGLRRGQIRKRMSNKNRRRNRRFNRHRFIHRRPWHRVRAPLVPLRNHGVHRPLRVHRRHKYRRRVFRNRPLKPGKRPGFRKRFKRGIHRKINRRSRR